MKWIAFLLLIFLSNAANAGYRKVFGYSVMPESRITISGTTNISQFACYSHSEAPTGSFLLEETGPQGRALRFHDADLQISVSSFDCGHRVKSRNMHQTLGVNKFPLINIQIIEAQNIHFNRRTSTGTARILVAITLNGNTQNVLMPVSYQMRDLHNIVVETSTKMRMTDFGVIPPTPVLGLVQVNDEITIDLRLQVEAGLLGVR